MDPGKEQTMLSRKKGMSALIAALLASATAAQPVAAQGYYGGQYYDQYGNPYGGQYGSQYGGQYGSQYGGQYGSQYGGQYGSQYGGQYGSQYGGTNSYGQYNSGYGDSYYGNDPYYDDRQRDEAARTWRDGYSQGYQHRAYEPDYRSDQRAYNSYRVSCEQQRQNRQVGGLLIGALAGGLLGNAVSSRGNRGTGTAVGAILGGAIGVGVGGRDLDCEDRGYVERVYYDGFERGRPHSTYRWDNPRSGNYGSMRVGDYYQDNRRNERCATYSQTIWVQGRPQDATGYACRRPDGTWEIIS